MQQPVDDTRVLDETGVLYVSDLDGTLLGSDGLLSASSLRLLNRMLDAGLAFTVATARGFGPANRVTGALRLRLPMVVYGGAFVVSPADGAIEWSNLLPAAAASTALEVCERRHLSPLVYWLEDGRDRVSWLQGGESEEVRAYLASRAGDSRMRPVSTWRTVNLDQAFGINLIGAAGPMHAAETQWRTAVSGRATVLRQLDSYNADLTWVEMSGPTTNKATAVEQIRRRTNATALVAFGDNQNDIPLFRSADRSFAVTNATPEAKAAATDLIPSNDEDAVAIWLAEHASV